jgi:hypothetical protein
LSITYRPGRPTEVSAYKTEILPELEAVIGRVIIQWSRTEQAIEELIWHFLGLPIDEGRVITSPLDTKYKISMLRGLGIQRIKGNFYKGFPCWNKITS